MVFLLKLTKSQLILISFCPDKILFLIQHDEFAENTYFPQTPRNGFTSGCVLSRTRPDVHAPKVGFEKVQKNCHFLTFSASSDGTHVYLRKELRI